MATTTTIEQHPSSLRINARSPVPRSEVSVLDPDYITPGTAPSAVSQSTSFNERPAYETHGIAPSNTNYRNNNELRAANSQQDYKSSLEPARDADISPAQPQRRSISESAPQYVMPANPAPTHQAPVQGVVATYGDVIPLRSLGHDPALIDCPFCKRRVVTVVQKMTSSAGNCCALALCCTVGICFAWIPLVVDRCKDCDHRCNRCGQLVGTSKSNGQVILPQSVLFPNGRPVHTGNEMAPGNAQKAPPTYTGTMPTPTVGRDEKTPVHQQQPIGTQEMGTTQPVYREIRGENMGLNRHSAGTMEAPMNEKM